MPSKTTKKTATKKRRRATKPKKVLGNQTKGLTVVRSSLDPDVRLFVASEIADEKQLALDTAGKAIEKCVYEFRSGKDMVRGLSIVGIREAVRYINQRKDTGMHIQVTALFPETDVEQNGKKGVLVRCKAVDHINGTVNWGVVFEPYKKPKRGGGFYDNPFAERNATSKAQRNAMAGLIPEELKQAIITKFVKEGKSQELDPPASMMEVKELEPSSEKKLEEIAKQSIEKLNDPTKLHTLAENLEAGTHLSKEKRISLAAKARVKGNRLLEAQHGDT